MRSARLGLLALSVGLLAACASSNGSGPVEPASPRASSGDPSATPSSGPTAAQNKAHAQAEADQLLAMASLPPGAVRVSSPPVGLTGPALGTPGTSQLIDSVSYYRVPMPLAQAYAWFKGRPPDGLTQSGTASGSGPAGVSTYGFEYDLLTTPLLSWGSASLDIGLASQGSATAIRVDGLAQWIDPAPTRDGVPGRAIRVTIAGGCPATDRGYTDISNPDAPDLDHQLLPTVPPTAALKCTYDGLNGHPFTLARSQRLNATQAGAAAAQIRAKPLGSRGLRARSCPMDDGRVAILAFGYPHRADVDVWDRTSGCSSTDNGHIIAGDF